MAALHLNIYVTLALFLVMRGSFGTEIVTTKPNVTLVVGTSASIPCGYDNKVSIAYWQKGELGSLEANNYVVTLDKRSHPAKRTYDVDRFNITDDYSLTIRDISLQDEGRYFCTIADATTGLVIMGHTDIRVKTDAKLVVTKPNITPGVGTSVSIPCEYNDTAFLVYWQKADLGTPEAKQCVVILDKRGHPSENLYGWKRFNISDDNSLIIQDTMLQDEGRYFCTVLDDATRTYITGYTDVVVKNSTSSSETSVILQLGEDATIPCRLNDITANVRWKKDGIFIDDDDRYDTATEDHSLFIRHVTIWDGGQYACEHFEPDENTLYQHVTNVTIIATPISPFPTIDVCSKNMERTTQECTHKSSKPLNLMCSVSRYFPDIPLIFLHDEMILAPLTSKETSNSDGTKNKEISIRAFPSSLPYTCIAYGLPGMGGERFVEVTITATEENPPYTTVLTTIAGVLVIVATLSLIMVYIFRKRRAKIENGTDVKRQPELQPLADTEAKRQSELQA